MVGVDYQLVRHDLKFGDERLAMIGIRDFDEAVNHVYLMLAARGESERLHELCPFFANLWPAARVLAGHLARRSDLGGQRILELGCGLGLPGILSARRGAQVTLSDFHPEVPEFLERNLALNDVHETRYVVADWRQPEVRLGEYDMIIGSDILYEREHPPLLVAFVTSHLAPGGSVIIADPGRAFLQDFERAMSAEGFASAMSVETIAESATRDVFVLEFKRPV